MSASILVLALAAAAPPNATFLYPAGARQGTTVDVTAGGTFDRWPVSVWSSVKGVEAKTGKDKGKLSVTVAADVPPWPVPAGVFITRREPVLSDLS